MRTRSPGHLKTFDYLGQHRYSLTFCTERRQALFTTRDVVDMVLEQISRAAVECRFEIIAYCAMPDHLHLLSEGQRPDSDAKRFIARAKQYSGYYYKQAHGSALWQRYGFEHVLRDEELALVVAKYILENPVRAGLVKRVEDYPFVGSMVYPLNELFAAIARSG
ncbi:MAG TPA: transposase [Vicinamibacterales bacterium]|nr:transposase [Vicinamibacterales bacterium]